MDKQNIKEITYWCIGALSEFILQIMIEWVLRHPLESVAYIDIVFKKKKNLG